MAILESSRCRCRCRCLREASSQRKRFVEISIVRALRKREICRCVVCASSFDLVTCPNYEIAVRANKANQTNREPDILFALFARTLSSRLGLAQVPLAPR